MIHYFKTEAKVRSAIRKLKKLDTVNLLTSRHKAQLCIGSMEGQGFYVLTYFPNDGNINEQYYADQTIQEKAAQL